MERVHLVTARVAGDVALWGIRASDLHPNR